MGSDIAGSSALFERDGDRFVPTELAQGPWSPEHQHGGPAAALLAFVAESVPTLVPMRCGRLTVDLMRPVPLRPLRASARVVREGKRLQLVTARLLDGDVEVAGGSVLRLRRGESAAALDHPRRPAEAPPRPPTRPDGSMLERAGLPVPGFLRALDVERVAGGLGLGAPAVTWFRLRVPVVAGTPTSPLVRLAALADFTSGTANFLDIRRWSSINADLSVHVLREPEGEWIAVDAVAHVAGDGIGHSRALLYDVHGMVGSGSTAQLVDEVPAPFSRAVPEAGELA